jgi:hypothetical protein
MSNVASLRRTLSTSSTVRLVSALTGLQYLHYAWWTQPRRSNQEWQILCFSSLAVRALSVPEISKDM